MEIPLDVLKGLKKEKQLLLAQNGTARQGEVSKMTARVISDVNNTLQKSSGHWDSS